MHTSETIAQHLTWWKKTNATPLVANYVPHKVPCPGLDIGVDPAHIVRRKQANAEASAPYAEEALVVARADFGPAFLPAVAGAGFEHDEHTSWNHPAYNELHEAHVAPFDPERPLYQDYLNRLKPLLECGWTELFLPGMSDVLGPLDIVAALVGSENLAIGLYEEPDEVRRLAFEAVDFLKGALTFEWELFARAGFSEGLTEAFAIWMPGRGLRPSEDVATLVGPNHIEQFFLEADSQVFELADSVFFHIHSAAKAALPILLQSRNLGAVELGRDPNGPDLPVRLNMARLIQSHNLSLQFSSWEIPMADDEIIETVQSLNPQGLLLRFQADSPEHSQHIHALIDQAITTAN